MATRFLFIAGIFLFTAIELPSALASATEVLRKRVDAISAGKSRNAGGELLRACNELRRFYESNDYRPVWTGDGDGTSRVKRFLRMVDRSAWHGLIPKHYHADAIARTATSISVSGSDELRLDLELLMTDAYLLLGSDYTSGRIDPESIDGEWFANCRDVDMSAFLTRALRGRNPFKKVESLAPTHKGYDALRKHLPVYRELRAFDTLIPDGPMLEAGDEDPRVSLLRERLAQLGDLDKSRSTGREFYDDRLVAAVKRFQTRHGIKADGVVGPKTWRALNVPIAERFKQILLNLERWRWTAEDLGERHVMVNIAGFELTAVEKGKIVLRRKVVVGKPYRRTPVFSDAITYLVFNPSWKVTNNIAITDKLPQLRKDPASMVRKGYEVFQGWGANEKKIDPTTVDWSKVTADAFPYHLVQQPGPANALGQVKFMFPNRFSVYLHDTPSQDRFNWDKRTFSSGCVRVQEPLELAEFVLDGQDGWKRQKIKKAILATQTQKIDLKTSVPVHITYLTAWVDETGLFHFRDDVYGRDATLMAALAKSPVE